ncbi:Protein LCHN [Trichoderma ghanense]|uniref:Protein LCHN n=1 Tax=Trichoderma ghanense TaxID=65468 RepID=A0ABY2GR00_9HYPO
MAPARRAHPSSLSVPPPPGALVDLPPIAALFLIDFDVKAGYTIAWKRAAPGLELEGVVEYKSLPSGLHTVSDDLIYFVHDGTHAGLSAFVNEPCEEEEARHARMIAVGILVPLSYGRLGRAWRHAENLKQMAATLAKNRNQTEILQKYWDANKAKEGETFSTVNTPISPLPDQVRKTHGRNSSLTDGVSLFQPEHKLSPYHPAWSLAELLDRFGPLIFPIHRAALLRQRILISCHAPVHEVCNFVYDISVLSNVPHSIADALPTPSPPQRLRPLFNIGVHDISFLMDDLKASKRDRSDASAVGDADESGSGWIACTTDSILATKDALWDMLITMPPDHSENAKEKAWPVVEYAGKKVVKATQRDLRRFNALRTGLARLAALAPTTPGQGPPSPASEASQVRLSTSHSSRVVKDEPYGGADNLVEPVTWAAFAYNGFMWWASAGEQIRSEEQEESTRDAALLADLLAPTSPRVASMSFPPAPSSPPLGEPLSSSIASLAGRRAGVDGEANIELAIITYFHRLTTQMLSVVIDIVDAADEPYRDDTTTDGEDDENDDENQALVPNDTDESELPIITIDSRSIEEMGLDVWSASDALFVQELAAVYFGRRAVIEGKGVEVCGVRVC